MKSIRILLVSILLFSFTNIFAKKILFLTTNTQVTTPSGADLSCRDYLVSQGYTVTMKSSGSFATSDLALYNCIFISEAIGSGDPASLYTAENNNLLTIPIICCEPYAYSTNRLRMTTSPDNAVSIPGVTTYGTVRLTTSGTQHAIAQKAGFTTAGVDIIVANNTPKLALVNGSNTVDAKGISIANTGQTSQTVLFAYEKGVVVRDNIALKERRAHFFISAGTLTDDGKKFLKATVEWCVENYQPANVVATPGNEKVSVAFTTPVNTVRGITGYVVTPYIDGVAGTPVSGSTSPIVVSGLNNGTTYTFKVKSVYSEGDYSPESVASSGVIPHATNNIINITGSTNTTGLTAVSDVDISGTLLVDANKTINNITIEPGGKLDLSNKTLSVNDIILKAGKAIAPIIKVTNAMSVSGSMKLIKTLDNSKWYFMSFPANVPINQIVQLSGLGTMVLGTNWWIKYYDGLNRAQNGVGSNWIEMTSEQTLIANKGYILGLANSLTGDYQLSFPLNKNLVTSAEGQTSINVSENTGAAPVSNHGWNLIGQPYLSPFTGSNTSGSFNFYISDGTSTYTAYDQQNVPSIDPFSAYFVQASASLATSGITFALAGRQNIRSVVNTDQADRLEINLISKTGSDYTLLKMSDDFNTNYEIGYDFEKWIGMGTNKPQIYTRLNGLKYTFNALPAENITNLPVGIYAKDAGILKFSATANNLSISALWLMDNTTGITTNLLVSDYSFNSDSGIDDSRFVISAQCVLTKELNISDANSPSIKLKDGTLIIRNLPTTCSIKIYDASGRVLIHKLTDKSSMEMPFSKTGFYTIQIQSELKNWTLKCINQ